MRFIVVTNLSDADMAAAMPGQVARVSPTDPNGPLIPFDALEAMLGLRVQNFTLGEVLLCDDDGREVVGDGRKPSKWGCSTEEFASLDAAVACSQQVVALADGVVM